MANHELTELEAAIKLKDIEYILQLLGQIKQIPIALYNRAMAVVNPIVPMEDE